MDAFKLPVDSHKANDLPVEACVGPQFRFSLLGIVGGGFSWPSSRCDAQRSVMVECAHADEILRRALAINAKGQTNESIDLIKREALPAAHQCLESVDRLALFIEKGSDKASLHRASTNEDIKSTSPDYCRVFVNQSQCL